jgi:hypothetical protein
MSKTSKISLYTQYDIDVIGDNIDILKKEAENFIAENYEQTAADFRETTKIIEQFVKRKNRITYGGYALNKLLINKDPSKAIYNKYSKPDIDFYTPEPLQDLKELCDLLLSKKVIDPRAQQAQHGDTYKLFINYDDGGDISYVPLHIYNKMPTITIDGIRYIHPRFMYIDYLRMYTDPLMSWFRIEKAIPRGMTLLNAFPLEVGTEKIKYEELSKNSSAIMGDLSKILSNVETIIHIGTYAVQFMTLNKDKLITDYYYAWTTSFYPAHHISTGEGGMVCTDDDDLITTMRSVSWWGRDCYCVGATNLLECGTCGKRFDTWLNDYDGIIDHKYVFTNIGYNLKPLDLQGAIGLEQLKKFDMLESKRREYKLKIQEMIESNIKEVRVINAVDNADPSWFGVPIFCESQDVKERLVKHFEDNKVQTRNYFAGNILLHPGYKHLDDFKKYPNSNLALSNVFFVGCSPLYNDKVLAYVEDVCKKWND